MQASGLLRQGDVLLVPIAGLPRAAVPVRRGRGRLVLAEGEATGHAHAVSGKARLFATGPWTRTSRQTRFLLVEDASATLVHEEHDPISIAPGIYRVLRQREYEPQTLRTWRQVAD